MRVAPVALATMRWRLSWSTVVAPCTGFGDVDLLELEVVQQPVEADVRRELERVAAVPSMRAGA